jgi:hypothetical protein
MELSIVVGNSNIIPPQKNVKQVEGLGTSTPTTLVGTTHTYTHAHAYTYINTHNYILARTLTPYLWVT